MASTIKSAHSNRNLYLCTVWWNLVKILFIRLKEKLCRWLLTAKSTKCFESCKFCCSTHVLYHIGYPVWREKYRQYYLFFVVICSGVEISLVLNSVCILYRSMSCQKNILSFFKPLAVKRPLSCINDSERDISNKKRESDWINEKDLTSKQESREPNRKPPFFSNYLQAKIKLISKRCPALHVNIGDSWFEALSPEFGKPYFVKVL
jgi:hypothetical protein